MDDALIQAVADEVCRRLEKRPVEPDYLTLDEVALRTGFSYHHIYRSATKGDLPATKKGREWRVAFKDMNQWMDQDRVRKSTPTRPELKSLITEMLPGLRQK